MISQRDEGMSMLYYGEDGVMDAICNCLRVASVGNGISEAVTLHSEDLAYAFGAPLVDGLAPFSSSGFTRADRLFSELVLRYWTNFIKTGSVCL